MENFCFQVGPIRSVQEAREFAIGFKRHARKGLLIHEGEVPHDRTRGTVTTSRERNKSDHSQRDSLYFQENPPFSRPPCIEIPNWAVSCRHHSFFWRVVLNFFNFRSSQLSCSNR